MLYFKLLFVSIHFLLPADAAFYDIVSGHQYLNNQFKTFAFDETNLQELWIEQPLDHFNTQDNQVWQMRYFERTDLWRPNGPIYLSIGGEGDPITGFLYTGLMYELAEETNGAMFLSEHRYYGKSIPLENNSAENMNFLSSRQALADIENLLKQLKMIPEYKNSKVVVVGGSYAGNLAAWLKLLYPNLIDAAISSSAPVLAKFDFYEYLETVSDDYKQFGTPGCWENIKSIFEKYNTAFKTQDGIQKLKKEENICETFDMNGLQDKQSFLWSKIYPYTVNAQYGNVTAIKNHCNNLLDSSYNPSLSNSFSEGTIWWNKEKLCQDINFDKHIDTIKENGLSWLYQICTEFGYAFSTTSDNQPFGKNLPADFFYKDCPKIFGPTFNKDFIEKAVSQTNSFYGGLKLKVNNVVFVNGEMDPWHRLGILEDLSNDTPAIIISQSSHCKDLLPIQEGDSSEFVKAREDIKNWIKKWIE